MAGDAGEELEGRRPVNTARSEARGSGWHVWQPADAVRALVLELRQHCACGLRAQRQRDEEAPAQSDGLGDVRPFRRRVGPKLDDVQVHCQATAVSRWTTTLNLCRRTLFKMMLKEKERVHASMRPEPQTRCHLLECAKGGERSALVEDMRKTLTRLPLNSDSRPSTSASAAALRIPGALLSRWRWKRLRRRIAAE